MTALEKHLRSLRDAGRKALVLYLTGGFPSPDRFGAYLAAVVEGGADAIEVGIPFSDPVIDGPVVQEASQMALRQGVTPQSVLDATAEADVPVPTVAMTYYNLVHHWGPQRFAGALAERGLSGAILPDLPLEESAPWEESAGAAGLATIMLAPPSAGPDRLKEICRRSTGFVYAQSIMGVTGTRDHLAATAAEIGDRLRAITDKPVMLGIGISTAEHAAAAVEHADGAIVGSALVRRILEGASPAEVTSFCRELRAGIDA